MKNSNLIGKVKTFFCSRYSNLLFSVLWIMSCAFLVFYVVRNGLIGYETNDDLYMEIITSGAFGKSSPFTVYTNIVIGYILVFLHKIAPMHNWFSILQIGGITLAFIVFGVFLIYKKGNIKGYFLAVSILLCSFDSLICKMNYSKTGVFLFVTGFVMFISFLDSEDWKCRKNRVFRMGAFLLMLEGGLMRKQTFIACIPFVVVLILYMYRKYRKEFFERIIPIVLSAVLLLFCWGIHEIAYRGNSEWKEFKEYDAAIIELLDYSLPEYDQNINFYRELGFSENDYAILKEWKNGDKDYFNVETLGKIVELSHELKKNTFNSERVDAVNFCLVLFSKEYMVVLLLLVFAFAVLYAGSDYIYYILSVLFLCYGELWALLMKGRLNERSLYIPVLAAFVMISYFGVLSETSVKKNLEVSLLLLAVSCFAYYGCGIYSVLNLKEGKSYNKESASAIFEYTSSHQDSLYVMEIVDHSGMLMAAYGPFDEVASMPHSNIATLGGWLVPTPVWGNMIEPFGEKYNVIKSLALNENVYMILPKDKDCLSVYYYIYEHYNTNVQVDVVEEIGEYFIYDFH